MCVSTFAYDNLIIRYIVGVIRRYLMYISMFVSYPFENKIYQRYEVGKNDVDNYIELIFDEVLM